jgi:hypothetical protein
MNRRLSMLALAAIVAGGACSRNSNRPADSALNTDLSLANQQKVQPVDSMSAAERSQALAATPAATTTKAPVAHTTTHTASRSTTHRSTGASSSGASSTGSSGTVASAPAPKVEKHTKRDAAIGAAAGAVLGATTSRNKVKGGIIGAAVGGVLGGVIGNNVDKTKKP